ncbi:HugZ family protein [Tropicimonas sp. S265A]|uniref:HugZ family pyridoxamine 5'-phosphate oxidase n=1 Tax=Tropicimonas sp. S265A TaxID=3415134 RepID=UPI003C79F76D
MPETSPIRPTDDEARALARELISKARFGALGVLEPQTDMPMVSRISVSTTAQGIPLSLISDLSHHTQALKADARCSLLVGEPGSKGDPLTHPRITLQCEARFITRTDDTFATLRARYLSSHPKAQLYIDFADFNFVELRPGVAHLNGGFGKAFTLTPSDLGLAMD